MVAVKFAVTVLSIMVGALAGWGIWHYMPCVRCAARWRRLNESLLCRECVAQIDFWRLVKKTGYRYRSSHASRDLSDLDREGQQ